MESNFSIFLKEFVLFLIPFLLGSLIFFSIIVAPNTFSSLDKANARKFIRSIFPKIYLWGIIVSLIIFIILIVLKDYFYALLFFLIFLGYFYSRNFLIKKINRASDRKTKKSENEFRFLHKLSVSIFGLQIIIMIFVYFNF